MENLLPVPCVKGIQKSLSQLYGSYFEIAFQENHPLASPELIVPFSFTEDMTSKSHERFLAEIFPEKLHQPVLLSAERTGETLMSILPPCHEVEAAKHEMIDGFKQMQFSVSDCMDDLSVIRSEDSQYALRHEGNDHASIHMEKVEKPKMARTIKSQEVPVLQEDIQNYDWSHIMSAVDWLQSTVAEEPTTELNILETWYGLSSPQHLPGLEDRSNVTSKDNLKTIPELRWIYDTSGDMYPTQVDCSEAKFLDVMEPLEMLEFEKLPLQDITSVLHACIMEYIDPQQISAGKEPESASVLKVDNQLLTEHCISKVQYDNSVQCPTISLHNILEDKTPRESPCPSTDDIQEKSIPDTALFNFEAPLFLFPACVNPLTCATDLNAARMPSETLPQGLSADCFDSLVVMPELRLDDQQFQSLPTPVLTELMRDDLQVAAVESVSSNCRPTPMTATDWLYLDWHFAHGRTCSTAACFNLQAKLKDSYEPISDFTGTTIRKSASTHWSKVALKLVGLENGPKCGTRRTCDEKSTKDSDESKYAQYQASVLNQDGGDKDAKICQSVTKSEPGNRTECNIQMRAIDTENNEARGLEMPAIQADFSTGDHFSSQCWSVRTSGNTLQNCHKNDPAAEVLIREELTSEVPGLKDAERSSRGRLVSGSALDDLACFVHARKGLLQNIRSGDLNANSDNQLHEMMNNGSMAPHTTTAQCVDNGEGGFRYSAYEHTVQLSVEIQTLITTLASDYRGLFVEEEIFGKETEELNIPGQFGFDSQGNSHIMTLIRKVSSDQPTQRRQVLLRGLTALHVLRHTALNLCTYGIQVAHLYLENLFDRISFLEEHILNSRVELEDAYNNVERGIYQDHPKLDHLEKLLKEQKSSQKILLIADRRAFFTLFKKLLSSGCNPYQIDRKEQYLQRGILHPDFAVKLREEIIDALSFSNCLLVPCAYITDSFPIENFTLVIQYAYCANDTAVEEVLRRGKCERHLLRVHVYPEEVNPATALGTAPIKADGKQQAQDSLSEKISKLVEPTDNPPYPPGIGGTNLSQVQGSSLSNAIDATGCNVQMERKMPTMSSSTDGCVTQDHEKSTENHQPTKSGYEMIIVANISQHNEHRWTERRNSYQKILSLEKNNLQVVERELRLPVDLLLSPATCLVIYTWSMLQKLVQNAESKQCLLRSEVDIILKAISFSYRDCILIFEGPADFTSAVLDVLFEIQAIAVLLELQVQCFISDGFEVTDKIVMKCIEAARQTKLLEAYPPMTEAPTIAEAFLTRFPTINSLTAHAILSSGCPLRTFLSMTLEQQFALVEDCGVSKPSLELFKAQCAFKEVGTSGHFCLRITSKNNHHKDKFDGLKDVGTIDRQRTAPLTNYSGYKDFLTDEERDDDLEISAQLPDRGPMFKSWRSNFDLTTIIEDDDESPVENSRKSVTLAETNCFPEFPPASEVIGDSELKAMDIELEGDDLPPKSGILGHQSQELVDQELFWPEEESIEFSTPNHEHLTFLLPKRRFGVQDSSFIASLDNLKASLSSWGEDGSDRKGGKNDKQGKIQHSRGSLDYGSFLAPNPFADFEEFCSSTDEKGIQDVSPPSTTLTMPYKSKSTCKRQLLQTSLDRFRHQEKNSKTSSSSQTAMTFPRITPRSNERLLPNPRSSIVTSYVPADKSSKKQLGLTRRGGDSQRRLVWINKNNNSQDIPKRQKKNQSYSI